MIEGRFACGECVEDLASLSLPYVRSRPAYRGRAGSSRLGPDARMVEVYYQIVDYKEDPARWGEALQVPLGNVLAETLLSLAAEDGLPRGTLVVPAPSYQDRRPHMTGLVRQAAAALEGFDVRLDLVEKVKDIKQRGRGRAERRAQSADAYRARARVDGATVIVADDVYTTGATLYGCARALRAAGAAAVYGAVLVRAMHGLDADVLRGAGRPLTVRMSELPDEGATRIGLAARRYWLKFGCSACEAELVHGPSTVPVGDARFEVQCGCGAVHDVFVRARRTPVGGHRDVIVRLRGRSSSEVLFYAA